MGACATKPKELMVDADAPRPIEAPDPNPQDAGEKKEEEVPDEETKEVASGAAQDTPLDESRRRSLGILFQENEASEENKVPSSSTDKNVIIENSEQQPSVEVKGKEQLKEQDQVEEKSEEHLKEQNHPETLNPIQDEKSNVQIVKEEQDESKIVKEEQEDTGTDASKHGNGEDVSEKKAVVDA
ncbi:hypothetical protein J5N97_021275 [Dioscorea zingiberensis]|uniref:Uncharacterized protein n=1 Tax=Dioscorea zingiberensis TaxID=325984 RepID=A0A9D5CHG5_9LILI|nr:hypothetical protein J5N97_021275 [Dioscorea zingiberensis]